MYARTGRFSKTASLTRRSTSRALLVRQRLRVREVEAQLVRAHRGAGLARVLAEHLLQRLVQEVRRGVIRHRREAHRPGHDRAHAHPRREALALEGQHLVVVRSRVAATSSARAPVSSFSMKPASVTWPPPAG